MGVTEQLARLARRALRLHGDAVGNARTSMRADTAAREHRVAVAAQVVEINDSHGDDGA